MAPLVLSWVSPVVAQGWGAQRWGWGFRLFTWKRPWRGPGPGEQPLPDLPSPAVQPVDMGAPGLLDVSVLLVRAWAWRATCHMVLSAVVPAERDTPPHPKNTPLLMSSQVAALSGC